MEIHITTQMAEELAQSDDNYVNVAYGAYVHTTLLIHDTPALASYFLDHCASGAQSSTAITSYYKLLHWWFDHTQQMVHQHDMIVSLLRCIKFTTIRMEDENFPPFMREQLQEALHRELDELFDFAEWCDGKGTLSATSSAMIHNIVDMGHERADRLVIS